MNLVRFDEMYIDVIRQSRVHGQDLDRNSSLIFYGSIILILESLLNRRET